MGVRDVGPPGEFAGAQSAVLAPDAHRVLAGDKQPFDERRREGFLISGLGPAHRFGIGSVFELSAEGLVLVQREQRGSRCPVARDVYATFWCVEG